MQLPGSNAEAKGGVWGALVELAKLTEEERRPVLRPHEQSTFLWEKDQDTIDLRNRLDKALGALTRFEIDAQTGKCGSADKLTLELRNIPLQDFPARKSLLELFRSEAFLNYCDTYLYFGIRFLAERFIPAKDAARERLAESSPDETTWRPFALMSPPALENLGRWTTAAFSWMVGRDPIVEPTDLHPASEEMAALLFLDGFLDSPLDYELWLRGLLPPTDERQIKRLETISKGMRWWIDRRVKFYLRFAELKPAISPKTNLRDDQRFQQNLIGPKIADELGPAFFPSVVFDKSAFARGRTRILKKLRRPPGGWRMVNPAAARFGLADVYWLSRLLRASVSSGGVVSYERTSWFHLLRLHDELHGGRAATVDINAGEEMAQSEEVLRAVFDFVCELVQNAISVTGRHVGDILDPVPLPENRASAAWQYVFDEELNEIAKHQLLRNYQPLPPEEPKCPPTKSKLWQSAERFLSWLRRKSTQTGDPASGESSGTTPSEGAPPAVAPPRGKLAGGGKDGDGTPKPPDDKGWSARVRYGNTPRNLVGLAFSGGGVRSATFNLGILQALQEMDLLRHVDYISTVSGGGFIGSWLVANVRRSVHWLGRATDWRASVAHLRAFSSYLAPRTGILSSDTWTLAGTWLRNTLFIQLTGLAWIFVLLLSALGLKSVFLGLWTWQYGHYPWNTYTLSFTGVLATVTILYQLVRLRAVAEDRPGKRDWPRKIRLAILTKLLQWETTRWGRRFHLPGIVRRFRARTLFWVRWLCIYPACVAAFSIASLFWHDSTEQSPNWARLDSLIGFKPILASAWRSWALILGVSLLGLTLIALVCIRAPKRFHALWIGPLCTGVLYLCLGGIFYLDLILDRAARVEAIWLAYVITPALVLFAFVLSVVLLIGFSGRVSSETFREWWTRLGAWLSVYPLAWVFVAAVGAFGPQLTASVSTYWHLHNPAIKWGTIISWAGTVLAGLFAGKSSKTNGESNKAPKLEALAVTGGVLFIVGGAVLASTLLYLLLFEIFAPADACYNCFLNTLDNLPVLFENSSRLPHLAIFWAWLAALAIRSLFSFCFEINIFGLSQFYRNRIVRCYLGATRTAAGLRKPNRLTLLDFKDDIKLHKLHEDPELDAINGPYRGPFPIINCALNLGGSKDLTVKNRHSASFSLTPLRCGSDRPLVGYAPTASPDGKRCFAGGIMLGQAAAISGAAVSPNMGYNTSPLVAFMLTMFNVRLGWWFPNPSRVRWRRVGLDFSLYYLTRELLGLADERRHYLNVSDGGHFENLGVYELVRRQCKVIIAGDGECDEDLQFGSLGNLIRMCEADLGAVIDIDVKTIGNRTNGYSSGHCAVGQIKYSNGSLGYLVYLKASLTGDEPESVLQHRSSHPSFPHETTADQFFTEAQFESYRTLGRHIVEQTFRAAVPGQHPVVLAEKLRDILTPPGCSSEAFLRHTTELNGIWDKFRQSPSLHPLLQQLIGKSRLPGSVAAREEERCIVLQLIQLMENVFLDLRLDDFWTHPDNRGWAILFMQWARSPRFRQIWSESRCTFGIRFEHFCAARLGLERDQPAVRV
jgi:hypothetical protein